MTHVAKTSQERQEQEEKSGMKIPQVEPTEEQKEMLERKLKRFFADNTPGPFQRKQPPEPRASALSDPAGFETVQAAIKELVDKKHKDATSTAATAELEPHLELPPTGQSTAGKPGKLSRRQRAAAAKKLKTANDDTNLELHPSEVAGSDEATAEEVTVADNTEMVELQVLQQAVLDTQARLDAFLEAHPGLIKETDKRYISGSREPAATSATCSAGHSHTNANERNVPGRPDKTEKASAVGPMTRLINAASQELEGYQEQQPSSSPLATSVKSKVFKEEAPTKKRRRIADPKSDVLKALKQMKREREGKK